MAFKQGSRKKKKPKDKHQQNISLSSSPLAPQYENIAKEIQEIREEERLSFVSFLLSSLSAHAKGEWKEHTRLLKLTGNALRNLQRGEKEKEEKEGAEQETEEQKKQRREIERNQILASVIVLVRLLCIESSRATVSFPVITALNSVPPYHRDCLKGVISDNIQELRNTLRVPFIASSHEGNVWLNEFPAPVLGDPRFNSVTSPHRSNLIHTLKVFFDLSKTCNDVCDEASLKALACDGFFWLTLAVGSCAEDMKAQAASVTAAQEDTEDGVSTCLLLLRRFGDDGDPSLFLSENKKSKYISEDNTSLKETPPSFRIGAIISGLKACISLCEMKGTPRLFGRAPCLLLISHLRHLWRASLPSSSLSFQDTLLYFVFGTENGKGAGEEVVRTMKKMLEEEEEEFSPFLEPTKKHPIRYRLCLLRAATMGLTTEEHTAPLALSSDPNIFFHVMPRHLTKICEEISSDEKALAIDLVTSYLSQFKEILQLDAQRKHQAFFQAFPTYEKSVQGLSLPLLYTTFALSLSSLESFGGPHPEELFRSALELACEELPVLYLSASHPAEELRRSVDGFLAKAAGKLADMSWASSSKISLFIAAVRAQGFSKLMYALASCKSPDQGGEKEKADEEAKEFMKSVIIQCGSPTCQGKANRLLRYLIEEVAHEKKEKEGKEEGKAPAQGKKAKELSPIAKKWEETRNQEEIKVEKALFHAIEWALSLTHDERFQQDLSSFALPTILSGLPSFFPKLAGVFAKSLVECQSASENVILLLRFLGLLTAARKLSLFSISDLLAPLPSLSSSSLRCVDVVERGLFHPSASVQMCALELLCISGKTTEEPSQTEILLIKKWMITNAKTISSASRQKAILFLKRFMNRYKEGLKPRSSRSKRKEEKSMSEEERENQKALAKEKEKQSHENILLFMHWLCASSVSFLYPGAPFCRSALAHRIIEDVIAGVWSDSFAMANNIALSLPSSLSIPSSPSPPSPLMVVGAEGGERVRSVLYSLFDKYDANRVLAYNSLVGVFGKGKGEEERGLMGIPNGRCFWENFMPAAVFLMGGGRASDCDAGARLFLVGLYKYGLTPQSLQESEGTFFSALPSLYYENLTSSCKITPPPSPTPSPFSTLLNCSQTLSSKIREKYANFDIFSLSPALSGGFRLLSLLYSHTEMSLIDFAVASLSGGMHGPLLGLRYLLGETNFTQELSSYPLAKKNWRVFFTLLIEKMKQIIQLMLPVVIDLAPEGFRPDGSSTSSSAKVGDCWSPVGQRIVVCCWRTMKEVGLLIQEIMEKVPLPTPNQGEEDEEEEREFVGGMLSPNQVKDLGDTTMEIVLLAQHKGVIEKMGIGFEAVCRASLSSLIPSLHRCCQRWITSLFFLIFKTRRKGIVTRRSAGLPLCFIGILRAEASRTRQGPMVTAVVETLLTILKTNLEILKSGEFTTTNKEEEEEEEEEENEEEVVDSFDWSQGPSKALEEIVKSRLPKLGSHASVSGVTVCSTVHCYNTLRTLLEDRVLGGDSVRKFMGSALQVALEGYVCSQWTVQNSATLLYSTVVNRILVRKATRDQDDPSGHSVTSSSFFNKYPEFYDFVADHFASPPSSSSRSTMTYAILALIKKLLPPKAASVAQQEEEQQQRDPEALIPTIFQLSLTSNDIHLRKTTGKALVRLIPQTHISSLLFSLVSRATTIYGRKGEKKVMGGGGLVPEPVSEKDYALFVKQGGGLGCNHNALHSILTQIASILAFYFSSSSIPSPDHASPSSDTFGCSPSSFASVFSSISPSQPPSKGTVEASLSLLLLNLPLLLTISSGCPPIGHALTAILKLMNTQKLFSEIPLAFVVYLVSLLQSTLFPDNNNNKTNLPMSPLFREGLGEVLVSLALRIGTFDCLPSCLQDRDYEVRSVSAKLLGKYIASSQPSDEQLLLWLETLSTCLTKEAHEATIAKQLKATRLIFQKFSDKMTKAGEKYVVELSVMASQLLQHRHLSVNQEALLLSSELLHYSRGVMVKKGEEGGWEGLWLAPQPFEKLAGLEADEQFSSLKWWVEENKKGGEGYENSLLGRWVRVLRQSSLSSMPINVRRAAARAVKVVGVVGGGEGGEGSRKRKRGEEEGKEGEDGGLWGMVEVECGVVGMRVLEDDDEDVRFEMTSVYSSPVSSSSSSLSTLSVPAWSLVCLWERLVEKYGDSHALYQIVLGKLIQPDKLEKETREVQWKTAADLFDVEPDNLWGEAKVELQLTSSHFTEIFKKNFLKGDTLSPQGITALQTLTTTLTQQLTEITQWLETIHENSAKGNSLKEYLCSIHQNPAVVQMLYRRFLATATTLNILRGVTGVTPDLVEGFRKEVKRVVERVVETTRPNYGGEEGKREGKGLFEGSDSHFVTWVHPSVGRVMEWVMGEREGKEDIRNLYDLVVV